MISRLLIQGLDVLRDPQTRANFLEFMAIQHLLPDESTETSLKRMQKLYLPYHGLVCAPVMDHGIL